MALCLALGGISLAALQVTVPTGSMVEWCLFDFSDGNIFILFVVVIFFCINFNPNLVLVQVCIAEFNFR